MNVELRRKGLPEKKVPDPEKSELPARKTPKQKSGLRYTSDLVSLKRSFSVQDPPTNTEKTILSFYRFDRLFSLTMTCLILTDTA